MTPSSNFRFDISLSVLDHLGRNLYRNFSTVIGEAISNAWDADASNVWIYVDRTTNTLVIKDDGHGMTAEDFQDKFLKIGYSKRRNGINQSGDGRPFIGRKGIGKLALLSCSDRISIVSKTSSGSLIGGQIDNSELNHAISEDVSSSNYALGEFDVSIFSPYLENFSHGTIIHFDSMKDGIRNSINHIRKIIALYFRFSIVDPSFNIYLDDELVGISSLESLIEATQFTWQLNSLDDPLMDKLVIKSKRKSTFEFPAIPREIVGFISSVAKPRDLKVVGTGEQTKVDLFVNGRLRERDVLRHIPTARVAESYLYGQIHFNGLDDAIDRFTSSRESVIADDPLFKTLLEELQSKVIPRILLDWDEWRIALKEDGDSDNLRIKKKFRKSIELFNSVSAEFLDPPTQVSPVAETLIESTHNAVTPVTQLNAANYRVKDWIDGLSEDAAFSFASFAECYVAENLLRNYILHSNPSLNEDAIREANKWKQNETENKFLANLSIPIRKDESHINYLGIGDLVDLMEDTRTRSGTHSLLQDSRQFTPIRNALMHTSMLTTEAKLKLTTVFDNIKAKVINMVHLGAAQSED